ncbi:3-isopropylmalate dehydrogenase [Streptomyces sp. NPDC006435]|uniref:3-isopropylmalate dehydrogenase n=1 Tax=Streptomyces sp. NPDC006435 TaxID=3154300 RepID=UPI00339E26B8
MTYRIAVLPGDGIGPEIMPAAERVLAEVGDFEFHEYAIGAAALNTHGLPLPGSTLDGCRRSDAVLLGAVGTGVQPTDPEAPRAEQGLLELRAGLGLFANLRPVRPLRALRAASPLRSEYVEGVDLLVVRELTGGLYFGDRGREGTGDGQRAHDTCQYTAAEIERVTRVAFELALRRSRAHARPPRLASVDKANALETSRLWREVVTRVAERDYPGVEVEHVLVDTAAMRLVTAPARFDVLLTENMFGDILSDEAAALAGSLGLLASASLPALPQPGRAARGSLFEPVHGSAPDIAGRGIASPLGMILSAALLLRHGLGLEKEANIVEEAVERAVGAGLRTRDLGGTDGTEAATRAVLSALSDSPGRRTR